MDFTSEEHVYSMKKMEFFEEWRKHSKEDQNARVMDYIRHKFDVADITTKSLNGIKLKISNVSSKFAERWTVSNKRMDQFLSKNKSWSQGADIKFTVYLNRPCPSSSSEENKPPGPATKRL